MISASSAKRARKDEHGAAIQRSREVVPERKPSSKSTASRQSATLSASASDKKPKVVKEKAKQEYDLSESDVADESDGEGAPATAGAGAYTSDDSDAADNSAVDSSAADAASSSAPVSASISAPVARSFKDLGVCDTLCEAAASLGWTGPTRIQAEGIPEALTGKDIIGLAETGSGKTGAFAIPILQSLLETPQRLYALVLAPTRELAFQIAEQFEALGSSIGLRTAVVVGGVDMVAQAIALAKKPHIVIGTPGRVVDHLENTKGFSLRTIKYLVLDEADRMLSLDFEEAINTILSALPRERYTYLFSATMTSKVAKLQRASLRDPVRVEVSDKYGTVSTLVQQYVLMPAKFKETYLVYILNEFAGQSGMVFVSTCASAQRTSLMLQNLGFAVTCLHGQMSQPKRLSALNKFKAGSKSLLIATDVASRGLDIPAVDLVINYDVPNNGKDYIHRVGRTARAGRAGRAVTLVTQYDIELYQRIEYLLGQKLEAFPIVEEAALLLHARVSESQRLAAVEMREKERAEGEDGGRRGRKGDEGEEGEEGMAARLVSESIARRRSVAASVKSKSKFMRHGK